MKSLLLIMVLLMKFIIHIINDLLPVFITPTLNIYKIKLNGINNNYKENHPEIFE
jgi:hypothetical protein